MWKNCWKHDRNRWKVPRARYFLYNNNNKFLPRIHDTNWLIRHLIRVKKWKKFFIDVKFAFSHKFPHSTAAKRSLVIAFQSSRHFTRIKCNWKFVHGSFTIDKSESSVNLFLVDTQRRQRSVTWQRICGDREFLHHRMKSDGKKLNFISFIRPLYLTSSSIEVARYRRRNWRTLKSTQKRRGSVASSRKLFQCSLHHQKGSKQWRLPAKQIFGEWIVDFLTWIF